MTHKILIVSQTHLCRNPRVWKEAAALSATGYRVKILTAIYSDELLQEDLELLKSTSIAYEFYSDLRSFHWNALAGRLIRKVAEELNDLFGLESKFSLGHNLRRLVKKCLSSEADLYIMHQELATVVGCNLIKSHSLRVAFDLEDWYSEDLLAVARNRRPIKLLKKAERFALSHGAVCYTTSHAMATAIAGNEGFRPKVIYNTFENNGVNFKHIKRGAYIRLYWLSQTTGPGRGIEFFVKAMAKSRFNWELTLRGNVVPGFKAMLEKMMAPKDRIIFASLMKNEDIIPDMANYDFGLALEPNAPPNKNLTISNKFFYYLGGGLPVIASDTLGHLEIGHKHPDVIFTYQNNDPADLVALLDTLGNKFRDNLCPSRELVAQVFERCYSWADESKKLVKLVETAVNQM